MAGFQKLDLKDQRNSENPKVLSKDCFRIDLTKSVNDVPRLNLNSTVDLAKLIASFLINKSRNLLLLAVKGFGDLPNLRCSEEWLERIHIPKKEGHRKRN